MALFRPGPLVTSISGAMGGQVFVAGKGAPVVRPRPPRKALTPTQGPSSQPSQKALFATLTRKWQTLTADQRAAWNTVAIAEAGTNRVGLQRPTTGFQWFLQYHLMSWPAVQAILTLPPLGGTATPAYRIDRTPGDPTHIAGEIFWQGGTFNPSFIIMYGAILYRRAYATRPPQMTLLTAIPVGGGGGLTAYSITPEWTARLPYPQTGQTFWLAVRMWWQTQWPSPLYFKKLVQ